MKVEPPSRIGTVGDDLTIIPLVMHKGKKHKPRYKLLKKFGKTTKKKGPGHKEIRDNIYLGGGRGGGTGHMACDCNGRGPKWPYQVLGRKKRWETYTKRVWVRCLSSGECGIG